MTDIKALPKPEGYDLRAARSEKAQNGRLWEGRDALFDISELLQKEDGVCAGLFVAYRIRHPDGSNSTRFRAAGNEGDVAIAMFRAWGRYMDWENKD